MNQSEIERILRQDPVWAGYALADLQPRFAPHCQWTAVQIEADGEQNEGLVLFFDLLEPTAIVTVGESAAVGEAFRQATLPAEIYLNIRQNHLAELQKHYEIPDGTIAYNRMVLPAEQPEHEWESEATIRLRANDEERMRALYSNGGPFTPDAFDSYQLENGVFFGVQDEAGALLAVGGTHIVDYDHRVAAIGNMYTHPQSRGSGLASSILRSIVTELRANQIEIIILNVAQANPKAQRLYERHGFKVHCSYLEGIAKLKS